MTTCYKKIKTVTRKPWHLVTDRWQITFTNGQQCSCRNRPGFSSNGGCIIYGKTFSDAWFTCGPKVKSPGNYTTTLRRIVNRKPKRKTREDD
jgi:hypothetical protein